MPLLVKVRSGGFFAEAGPQFGFLLEAREEGCMATSSDDGNIEYTKNDQSTWNDYKKSDVSLCVGVGFKLLAGLSVGARFVAGLNDIRNPKPSAALTTHV